MPLPRHGAQISGQATTKGYVQTGARARALGMGTKGERGLRVSAVPYPRRRAVVAVDLRVRRTVIFVFQGKRNLGWVKRVNGDGDWKVTRRTARAFCILPRLRSP